MTEDGSGQDQAGGEAGGIRRTGLSRRAALLSIGGVVGAGAAAAAAAAIRPSSEGEPSEPTSSSDVAPDVVRNFSTLSEMMLASPPTRARVMISGFESPDDGVTMSYEIRAGLPRDRVLSRIAVPLADGRFAVPLGLRMLSQSAYDIRAADEMVKIARTYVAAGDELIYDSSRHSPLTADGPVHAIYERPYPITCSSFVALVLMSVAYADSTYVVDKNRSTFAWGVDFPRREDRPGPFQAHKLLAYYQREGMASQYQPGMTKLKRGDLLFFCKQDPEGAGTGGRFWFNAYHVGLYTGAGMVVHAYSRHSGNGVIEQRSSDLPMDDLCFVVSPNVAHLEARSAQVTTSGVVLPEASGTISTWYQNDLMVLRLDGVVVDREMAPGTYELMRSTQLRPFDTVTGGLVCTAGVPCLLEVSADGRVVLRCFGAIPAGAAIHGTVQVPVV